MPTQIVGSHTDHKFVISKDPGTRYGVAGILGTLFLLGLLTMVLGPLFEPNSNVNSPLMIGKASIVGVLALLTSIYFIGPCEIHFDSHTRRYRFISGLPFLVRTVEGPYEDIAAIVIRPYPNKKGRDARGNRLAIEWTVPGRKTAYIRFLTQTQSYALQDEIKQKTGLPVTWET